MEQRNEYSSKRRQIAGVNNNVDDKDLRIKALEYEVRELRSMLRLARVAQNPEFACVRCQIYECHTIDGLCRECNYDDLFPGKRKHKEPGILAYMWFGLKRKFKSRNQR